LLQLLLGFLFGEASPEGYAAAFVVVVLLCIWLARRQPHFFSGAVRVFSLLVAAPWRYWRTLVAEVAQEASAAHETREVVRGVPMLRALQSVGKLLVIVASIAATLAGVRAAVSGLLPPNEVRKLRSEVKEELAENKLAQAAADQALVDFDASLAERVRAAEEARLKQARARRDGAEATMKTLRAEIAGSPEAEELFAFLEEQTSALGGESLSRVESAHRQLRRRMESATWAGGSDGPLPRWLDAWKAERTAAVDIAEVPAVVAREQAQQRSELERNRSRLTERRSNLEERLVQLNEANRLRWGRFASTLVSSVVGVVLLVWVLGLALDGFSLWVGMAGDIRELRLRTAGPAGPAGKDELA
jgi:hypothetical protein